jgi:hypothetical protein
LLHGLHQHHHRRARAGTTEIPAQADAVNLHPFH